MYTDTSVFFLVLIMAIIGVVVGWVLRGFWERFKVDREAEKEKRQQEQE